MEAAESLVCLDLMSIIIVSEHHRTHVLHMALTPVHLAHSSGIFLLPLALVVTVCVIQWHLFIIFS